MVKVYSSSTSYPYPLPTVSLAYFLRYPNPYSTHVASTDTLSRNFDPTTQRLTTVRLHIKRSRLPPGVVKLLPKSDLVKGEGADGGTQSFILESSVVDVRQGWMETESRNLDWENVLQVIERQTYRRPAALTTATEGQSLEARLAERALDTRTECETTVTLKSRIGEQLRRRRQRWGDQPSPTTASSTASPSTMNEDDEPQQKQSWFQSWSSGAIRAAIETISLQRTEKSQPKAVKGMSVVLERLRTGGVQGVLEGMRADGEVKF